MSETEVPVVISGAGPNGLMLACELALAGVRPVVLERLPAPSDEPKANGMVGQVIRMLDMRGLYQRFSGSDDPPKPVYEWIFSGMSVQLFGMWDNPMYALMMSQPRLVRMLDQRARELGVDIRWGDELIGLESRSDGVKVSVSTSDETYALEATYLVGADGGRSTVRKLAGIDFAGYTSNTVARIAHVSVPDELRSANGGLDVPGVGLLPWGHNRLDKGGFIFAEMERGRPMVGTIEFDQHADDSEPLTLDELRDSARRVLGADLPIEPPVGDGPHALRRIAGQNTRQADRYRAGNIFLLGDSAHVHSAMGGPGLNLGLQDAMNLGWKLAAAVNGWAPADLLDTYHSERYPVGERWTPLILRDLFAGMTKFEDLRRDLGIASNVLATRLDELERNGVVERRQYQSTPARHEYLLSEKGRDLYPVIATLLAFGDKWLSAPNGPPALIVHTDCGHATTAKTVCVECGGELNAHNAIHAAGPGANPGPGTALIGDYITH